MGRRSDIEALVPGLRRYAWGLTGDAETADDLVQGVILSALRSVALGRGAPLRRRLYAVLTDYNRMRVADLPEDEAYGGEPRGVVAPFERPAARGPGPDPLAGMALAEREAILLVAVEGFDYIDASDIIGVSRPALIARLAKARGDAPAGRGAASGGRRHHLRLVS